MSSSFSEDKGLWSLWGLLSLAGSQVIKRLCIFFGGEGGGRG